MKYYNDENYYYSSEVEIKLSDCVFEEIALENCYSSGGTCDPTAYYSCMGFENGDYVIVLDADYVHRRAVNYIAKGEEIRIPIPDASVAGENGYTEETLTFTYMNAGYVGYSNNGTSDGSTDTLTMGAFELCNNTIEIARYSTDGLYTTETIERVNPNTTDPYVRVSGETTGTEGNSDIVYGSSGNIEGATYSWSTTDDSVVKVLPAGKNAQVIYTGAGTADVVVPDMATADAETEYILEKRKELIV